MAQVAEALGTRQPVEHPSSTETLVNALRGVTPLAGLSDDDLRWLAEHGTEVRIEVGEHIFREGDKADAMSILLDGEITVTRGIGSNPAIFTGRARELTGVLPHSRMKNFGGNGYVTQSLWALVFPRTMFPQMLAAVPALSDISAGVLLDRVREVTRMEQQTEKLNALNQLAGNLSHELNNPASAAQRSASHLHEELRRLGEKKFELGSLCLSSDKMEQLQQWSDAAAGAHIGDTVDTLAAAEGETQLLTWLQQQGVAQAWELAPALAEAGVRPPDLDQLTGVVEGAQLGIFLQQFAAERRADRMADSILSATQRIFTIINAIKDYANLDQAPIQEVSIPQSLRTTLMMLHSRLAKVEIVESFAPDLPKMDVIAGAMNQVWMALLENALDAMHDEGTLELRAYADAQMLTVEIIDSGPGISDELRPRIFEPFFSTKGPGSHLGLGLDTVTRIVRRHRGSVSSVPMANGTCFQVRLPRDQGRAY